MFRFVFFLAFENRFISAKLFVLVFLGRRSTQFRTGETGLESCGLQTSEVHEMGTHVALVFC